MKCVVNHRNILSLETILFPVNKLKTRGLYLVNNWSIFIMILIESKQYKLWQKKL